MRIRSNMQRNSLTCSEQNKNSISKTNSTEMDTKMLSYNKLCELEDFTHPKLQPIISSIFLNGKNGLSQGFPNGQEYRKHWEIAMSVRALADGGAIHPKSKLLGVGAGNEPTSFYLKCLQQTYTLMRIGINLQIWVCLLTQNDIGIEIGTVED